MVLCGLVKRTRTIVVNQGSLALHLAYAIADATNIPLIKGVLGVAILIVGAVERVEADLESCQRIGQKAITLSLALYEAVRKIDSERSSSVEESIIAFKSILEESLHIIITVPKWSWYYRFLFQFSIRKSLADVICRIDNAYEELMLRLGLRVHETLLAVHEMLRTISDGSFQSRTGRIINDEDFRILKFGDIHKLPPELRLQGSWRRSMIGRVDGQVCLVKVYDVTVKGDPERFARDLEFGRKTKVAFIPQVFGYTVGSRERYIVHSLDVSNAVNFVPMMDYIQRKYKSDTSFRVKDVLAMPADIVNALNYLVDRRIITSEEDMKSMLQLPELVIGPNDKILIGTGGIPQRFTIPEAADGEQQGWGDINSEYASPYSHKTAPLVKPPHWVVGVVFHEIYEDFCKTYRDKPEMEIVKYAHDILHDNCEGVLKSDWRAARNLRSIREYRQITCPNIPDPYLCLYLPPKGTSLPSPGDVAVWVKEDGRRELMTPNFSCGINVHEQITITDDGNSPDRFRGPLFQGEWENKITDELPGGVVRFTFVRPSIIKLWDSRGGHRSLIGYQAAHTFLRKNARSMAQKLQCLPQDIMIVTLAQENYIRAEFVPVAGPQDPESERYYFYIHYEETDTPRRAYWSLSDSPCASGVPDDIPGCTLIRWPLYNYVQLTDADIL